MVEMYVQSVEVLGHCHFMSTTLFILVIGSKTCIVLLTLLQNRVFDRKVKKDK